jgi:hypothetical protein
MVEIFGVVIRAFISPSPGQLITKDNGQFVG